MAVLELRYQSSGPSAPRHLLALRALRSTPFHSIPLLLHPGLPWKLSRNHTPLLVLGKTPVKHGASPATLPRKPCPHFLGACRSIPLDVYAWYPPFSRLLLPQTHLCEHLYCILHNMFVFSYRTRAKLFR